MDKKEFIEASNYEKCEFDDECNFCESPSGGSWVQVVNMGENGTEYDHYICDKCLTALAEKSTEGNFYGGWDGIEHWKG